MSTAATQLRLLDGGQQSGAWAELWELDDWRRSQLPQGDLTHAYRGNVTIKLGAIAPAWLKEASKRWFKSRILSGGSVRTLSFYASDLTAFSNWLRAESIELTAPAELTRTVLDDYMLFIRRSDVSDATKQRRVGTLRMLIDEQANDGLLGIERSAQIHTGEVPRVGYRLPKELDDFVFQQIIDPKNLRQLSNVRERTVILLLAHTGMRVSSIVTLAKDAMVHGADGHPYLRYINIKMARESVLPIPPELAQQIGRQLENLKESGLEDAPYLLPSPRNPDTHIAPSTLFRGLRAYVIRAGIKHRDGSLAIDIHPHLFRHHVGTSMVNAGVPLPVVQRVLDHQSVQMTAHYAQLQDATLRREVQQWHERVNIRGERIALEIQGPLADAEWMKERISRARQALPNGYCGLPLVQTCPHPNACLSCDNFLTDASFADIHVTQLARTRELIDRAQEHDHQRQLEALRQDELSLVRIVEGLESLDQANVAAIHILDSEKRDAAT